MRRLLSSVALSVFLAGGARAQTGSGSEGALFLLLPTGAQAVGMGQAMVAGKPGSEGIWWNPASIAGEEKRELAIHHSKTVAGVGDALSFVMPTRSHGTGALSINILNIGEQQVTDNTGQVIGVILPRDVVFAASYAESFTKRLTAGLNYKVIQLRVDCSGQCASVGAEVKSSRAVDLGTQFTMQAGAPLTFGAAIRNLGGRLNSRETNQRDPLPTQVELGATYRLKFIDHYVKDTELRASGSFIDSRSFGGKAVRFGTDVMYQSKVHLRAGYVGHDRRGDASASLGFGLQSGGFIFDIARTFGGLPADNGQSPVYVSLRYLFLKFLYALLIFVPIALVAKMFGAPPIAVFILSAVAIIPLSSALGTATEAVAERTSPAIGGLLNATMGNLAELIIAAMALRAGLIDLVKASITGSIIGNLLLVLGAALLAGGLKFKVQSFNPHLAGFSATVLVVAAFGLLVPALFQYLHPDPGRVATQQMSYYVAALLISGYGFSLLYSLRTHTSAFLTAGAGPGVTAAPRWSSKQALIILVASAVAIGVISELLVSVTEEAVRVMGLSEFFVGLILIPIIGNAAEHSSAILMAMKNRMDLAINVAVGSSIQVALLIGPLLVFLGVVFGQRMDLAFSQMEVASIALSVAVATSVMRDAESNWLEGVFLLLAYAVLGVAFFFF